MEYLREFEGLADVVLFRGSHYQRRRCPAGDGCAALRAHCCPGLAASLQLRIGWSAKSGWIEAFLFEALSEQVERVRGLREQVRVLLEDRPQAPEPLPNAARPRPFRVLDPVQERPEEGS